MFDKLIVSDEHGAEFKGRSRYFMVSTAVVGILFVTALVFSLYATDIGLGNDDFELSMMLAPVTPDAPEPTEPEADRDPTPSRQSSAPTRVHNILRPEESPTALPDKISVEPSAFQSRPTERFEIGTRDTPGIGIPGEFRSPRGGATSGGGTGTSSEPVAESNTIPPPPPAIKAKPTTMTLGVINGKATNLPKPPYPAAAIAINAQGEVMVQVTIDETGKVISAKAAKGHPILKPAAERAAWQARFTPTLLSGVPVKVTGVIVYHFKRS